jgi:uncharacterized protein YcbK (DUF882 family)
MKSFKNNDNPEVGIDKREIVYSRDEFKCPCCGRNEIKQEVIDLLTEFARQVGYKLEVTSGYRCEKHNREVGGVPNSFHTQGKAVDVKRPNLTDKAIRELAWKVGFGGVGIYRGRGFIHLDIGPKRTWEE